MPKITDNKTYRKALIKHGFVLDRQGGSHSIYKRSDGLRALVPRGTKTSDFRTIKNSIAGLRRMGVDLEEQE